MIFEKKELFYLIGIENNCKIIFYFKILLHSITNSSSTPNNVSSQIHQYLGYVDSNSFIMLTLHYFFSVLCPAR
jgi:hypothetical protein